MGGQKTDGSWLIDHKRAWFELSRRHHMFHLVVVCCASIEEVARKTYDEFVTAVRAFRFDLRSIL